MAALAVSHPLMGDTATHEWGTRLAKALLMLWLLVKGVDVERWREQAVRGADEGGTRPPAEDGVLGVSGGKGVEGLGGVRGFGVLRLRCASLRMTGYGGAGEVGWAFSPRILLCSYLGL